MGGGRTSGLGGKAASASANEVKGGPVRPIGRSLAIWVVVKMAWQGLPGTRGEDKIGKGVDGCAPTAM